MEPGGGRICFPMGPTVTYKIDVNVNLLTFTADRCGIEEDENKQEQGKKENMKRIKNLCFSKYVTENFKMTL